MASKEALPLTEAAKTAEQLLLEGRATEASRLLSNALSRGETSELWNDWAAAQLLLAEQGFRRAVQLDPNHPEAATNLGIVLFSSAKFGDAVFFLERALASLAGLPRAHVQTLLLLCATQLAGGALPSLSDREAIARHIRHILDEYFSKGNRSPAIVTPRGFEPMDAANPSWIEGMLNGGSIHDEDYLVFGAFKDPDSTILDVGAHFGYSAVSIWSSGAASRVVSFEANRHFESCLQHIGKLRPGRYDYRLTALGSSQGILSFAMPVLNGHALGALTTANPSPDLVSLLQNVMEQFGRDFRGQLFTSFRIYEFQSPVARLDDLLADDRLSPWANQVVAVKVDTEGHEAHVLSGCPELLTRKKPLLLVESGHTNSAVCRLLLDLGYHYAGRVGKQLRIVEAPTTATNGFFVHPYRSDEYRRIGLLKP